MENKKPVILCIMDGYGIRHNPVGNAVYDAKKPNLDRYFATHSYTEINASGEYVGLPDGQMGNSEVGHMNMGAGRIVYQSLTLINKAIKEKTFFKNEKYLAAIEHAKKNHSKLHIFGLTSDGGVHSHINHILAIIELAAKSGLDDVYMHCFMDGRDVDPQAGASYVDMIQKKMDELHFGHIADIGGRYWGMDLKVIKTTQNTLLFTCQLISSIYVKKHSLLVLIQFFKSFSNSCQSFPTIAVESSCVYHPKRPVNGLRFKLFSERPALIQAGSWKFILLMIFSRLIFREHEVMTI